MYKILVVARCFLGLCSGHCSRPSHAMITSEVNTLFTLQHPVYCSDAICFLNMAGSLFGEMISEDGMSVSKKKWTSHWISLFFQLKPDNFSNMAVDLK